jgi:hypothetical protein
MVVEIDNDISVDDCPADVATMTDGPRNFPCTDPADLIFGGRVKELGKPFATGQ